MDTLIEDQPLENTLTIINDIQKAVKRTHKKCDHGKQKYQCRDCSPHNFCNHGTFTPMCKTCNPKSFCEHGEQKSRCRECKGVSICEHNKIRIKCKDCHGSQICEHNLFKNSCKHCSKTLFCTHGKRLTFCSDCGGSEYCIHNKKKRRCKICGGKELCKSEWCHTRAASKYNGYCLPCCIHMCPEIQVSRNYKTKEKDVVDRITTHFPDFTWVADRKVQDGCSKRRPDLLLDMGSHIIIIEIDENKHTDYDCSCENKRLMELSQDLQHRPIIFIRFNPDDYIDQSGNKIKSCWKLNKLGVMQISKSRQTEWEQRITVLIDQIQYWLDNPTQKTVEIVELFY